MSTVSAEYGRQVDMGVRGPWNLGVWLSPINADGDIDDALYFTIGQAETMTR